MGFSINETPDVRVMQTLRSLSGSVRLFARDPLSLERLYSKAGLSGTLSADVAFLLSPATTSTTDIVATWISGQKLAGRVVIGINANHLLIKDNGNPAQTVSGLIGFFSELLEALHETDPRLCFVLIPHDYRGKWSDDRLSGLIYESLSEQMKAHVLTVANRISAAEAKTICSHIDFLITGRMHLAIAALGQAIPTACISYQGKVLGLFELFRIQELAFSLPHPLDGRRFAEGLLIQIKNRHAIKGQLERHLDKVLSLASKNFEGL